MHHRFDSIFTQIPFLVQNVMHVISRVALQQTAISSLVSGPVFGYPQWNKRRPMHFTAALLNLLYASIKGESCCVALKSDFFILGSVGQIFHFYFLLMRYPHSLLKGWNKV